jgi:protein TonB
MAMHGMLLAKSALWHLPTPHPKVMEVDLRPMPAEEAPPEPLLKNTIETPEKEDKPTTPPPAPEKRAEPVAKPKPAQKPSANNAIAAAQKKLSKHLYYPPEAITAGLEGEVRLRLSLDEKGHIVDADVAATSGHAVLDKAALRAAWAMGSVEGADKRAVILPVVFRLR